MKFKTDKPVVFTKAETERGIRFFKAGLARLPKVKKSRRKKSVTVSVIITPAEAWALGAGRIA